MGTALIAADVSEVRELAEALQSDFDTAVATTMKEAFDCAAALRPSVIVVSLHFDGSKMFDFLIALKKREDLKDIPIVCCQVMGSILPKGITLNLETATRMLGGCEFINVATSDAATRKRQLLKLVAHCIETGNHVGEWCLHEQVLSECGSCGASR